MNQTTWQAEQFEQQRPQLQAVAYRMLGSVSEAEDAVQETWLRLSRSNGDGIANIGGWLTTVVGRVCIDMLRARRSRREELVGSWMPEPIVSVDEQLDPEHEALLADAVGIALLVVLESLSPSERLAFVLHDMFAVPFSDIAPIVERSPDATRQLASRARRRVRGAAASPDADTSKQREVVDAFLAATRSGDFDALLALLDPEVVFRADGGPLAGHELRGIGEVSAYIVKNGPNFAPYCKPALVNGAAGFVVQRPTGQRGVVGMTVVRGRITQIDLIIDPDKLRAVELAD
jgi:RNA polymerase sigma-70 factor (ECF subfamily)